MPRTKKTTTSTTSPSKTKKTAIIIRMYNPGYGDCFLLTFQGSDGKPRHMLIDCGVHQQYTGGPERLRLIANDIAKETKYHLDIVAVTHEHADHISGFSSASETFKQIQIDDLWLAWTEDPNDLQAKKLKGGIKKSVEELTAAVNKLAPTNLQASDALRGILGFEVSGNASGVNKSELDYLRDRSKKKLQKAEDYRRPGEDPLMIPGVNGVKVYVLAPPREDITSFKTTEKESEMYPEFAPINAAQAFAAALKIGESNLSTEDENIIKRSFPFDKRYCPTNEPVQTDPAYQDFFRKYYGFTKDITQEQGEEWRRIDDDWLGSASELALKINSMTNNTSLVLAFELTDSTTHKVLLFVGDAQVGNWLSWPTVHWGDGTLGKEKITGANLLQRTAFYKVGHHGSRNATLSLKGLEMMDDTKLVAMIPVDQEWAKRAQGWKHPASNLLDALEKKTKYRLLRADMIPTKTEMLAKPDSLDINEWQDFIKAVEWDKSENPLWIQYKVEA